MGWNDLDSVMNGDLVVRHEETHFIFEKWDNYRLHVAEEAMAM
jgi:hypothetical protein